MVGGTRFETVKKNIRILKQKHWMDFYHYMMVVYKHCQHTFQYN